MLSMSEGLTPAMEVLYNSSMLSLALKSAGMSFPSSIMPSNTHSGSVLPVRETVLRMRILLAEPGAPFVGMAVIPATAPSRSWSRLATPIRWMSAILTVVIAEVSWRLSIF